MPTTGSLSRHLPSTPRTWRRQRRTHRHRKQPANSHARPVGRHAHDRLAEPHTSRRPQKPGVAKGEHTAIGSNQPIATPVRSGRHPHDRGVDGLADQRAVIDRSAEGADRPPGWSTQYPLRSGLTARREPPAAEAVTVAWASADGAELPAALKALTT